MIDLREVLSTKRPKVGDTLFVAVDGHGGSGKSTLAQVLGENLGAAIVHTDDFAGWLNPLDWWPAIIERVFAPIQNGAESLSYPRSAWWPDHHPEPVVGQSVTRVMILEGVSALRREFRYYISLGIWIDTPRDVCLERGIERELATGKSRGVAEREWEDLFAAEDEYVRRDAPLHYADIVIEGRRPFEEQVQF